MTPSFSNLDAQRLVGAKVVLAATLALAPVAIRAAGTRLIPLTASHAATAAIRKAGRGGISSRVWECEAPCMSVQAYAGLGFAGLNFAGARPPAARRRKKKARPRLARAYRGTL